jgi:hypothetical protein
MRRFSVLAAFLLVAGCVDHTRSECVTNHDVDLHLS